MKTRKQPSLPKIRNVPTFMTTDNFTRSPNISMLSNKHDRSDMRNDQSKYRPPSSHTLLLQSNADASRSLDLPEFFGSNVCNRRVKQLLNEGLKELQVCNIDAAFPLLEQCTSILKIQSLFRPTRLVGREGKRLHVIQQ